MCEFSDLNLNITHLTQNEINNLVEFAIERKCQPVLTYIYHQIQPLGYCLKVGYDNLALAIEFEFPLKKEKQNQQQQIQFPKKPNFQLSARLSEKLKRLSRKIKIFDRITIKIKDTDLNVFLHLLKNKEVLKFDIVALSPSNGNVLQYLCTNNYNAEVISIDCGIECSLTDKHLVKTIRCGMDSLGVNFEMNYNLALSSTYARRDFIMLGRSLTFNTKSNGLIISSNASTPLHLRAPYDLISIAKLFDITDEKCHNLVRYCPSNVILKSFIRKHTAAGIVYFENSSDLDKLKKFIKMQTKLKEAREVEEPDGDDGSASEPNRPTKRKSTVD